LKPFNIASDKNNIEICQKFSISIQKSPPENNQTEYVQSVLLCHWNPFKGTEEAANEEIFDSKEVFIQSTDLDSSYDLVIHLRIAFDSLGNYSGLSDGVFLLKLCAADD